MDSNNLNDFRPDYPKFNDDDSEVEIDTPIQASEYPEEINTLKIDKLSNRVTIISIIIPCLVGAILIFAYMDMKERVVDADINKQTQFEKISRQLEEKINALDVKIAKNKYDLDSSLPALKKKDVALEGQLAKKANAGTIKKLEKRVSDNTSQSAAMNEKTLTALKETRDRFDKTAKQIKDDITLFKDEFDARLLELSEYEQQIGTLRKDFSLLDKKQKSFSQESFTKTEANRQGSQLKTEMENQIKQLDTRLKELDEKMSATISKFQDDIDSLTKNNPSKTIGTSGKVSAKPSPRINIDSSKSVGIKEEPLKQ